MARRLFIAGNWKMNLGPAQAAGLALELKAALASNTAVDVAVAPVAVSIPAVAAKLKHSGLHVAGQDLHAEASGAFTGAVPGEHLREAGCTYVIVGHSERRQLFGDDDALIAKKVKAAFRAGLLPILWGTGTGSEVMSRIAAPMVGGMISSTVLTLAVIPAIYALVKQWSLKRGSEQ